MTNTTALWSLLMNTMLVIMLSIRFTPSIYAQKYSITIDSLTHTHISRLSVYKQQRFKKLIKQRIAINYFSRIDTLPFDYAFIREIYCFAESQGEISESYFVKSDTIPKYIYEQGKSSDPNEVFSGMFSWYAKNVTYKSTLSPMLEAYTQYKAVQQLAYDKQQIWHHGCVIFDRDEPQFIRKRKRQLKTTYEIRTLIDRMNQRIMVSMQFAPKKPKFETVGYNAVWDF